MFLIQNLNVNDHWCFQIIHYKTYYDLGRGNSSTLMVKHKERNLKEEINSAVTASTRISEEEDFFEILECSICEYKTSTKSTERTQEVR